MQDSSAHSGVIVSLIFQFSGHIFVNMKNLLHYEQKKIRISYILISQIVCFHEVSAVM
jgi:hypothetical protein